MNLRLSYAGGTGNDITLSAPLPVTTTWNGSGANDNWSTGANWIGGAAPASGNTTFVTFPAASARFGPVPDAPWTINRMDIVSATAYAMTGSAITFAAAAPQLNASQRAKPREPVTLVGSARGGECVVLHALGPSARGGLTSRAGRLTRRTDHLTGGTRRAGSSW